MKPRKKSKYTLLLLSLMVCFSVMIGVSTYMLLSAHAEYSEGEESYVDLLPYVSIPYAEQEPSASEETTLLEKPVVDFDALKAVNPDIIAWLFCEGTPIHSPIVQGDDNEYCLDHLFDGTRNGAGCLFMDYRNAASFSDQNSIVYGHNMKNKTMFSVLMEYKKQAFYEERPTMLLITPEGYYTVDLFAGFVAATKDNAWKQTFSSQTEQEDWIRAIKENSTFQSDTHVGVSDKLLTLSACS